MARVACVGAMLATNALMLSYFVRGLHATDSLTATVTSAAVNFMLSVGHFVAGMASPFVYKDLLLINYRPLSGTSCLESCYLRAGSWARQ